MPENPVRFLSQEDPLEKGWATHSSILGLPWWLTWQRMCLQCRRPLGWVRSLSWEDPLEDGLATYFSILAWRNPMDRGAWWATVCGIAKSWTQLKQLNTAHKFRSLDPYQIHNLQIFSVFCRPCFFLIVSFSERIAALDLHCSTWNLRCDMADLLL